VIGKPYDSMSPVLLTRVATGQHIASVVLSQDNAAGTFRTYTLSDVTVVDHEHTQGPGLRRAPLPEVREGRGGVPAVLPDASFGAAKAVLQ
jgi:type VI protein secretion system component Hcp